MGAIAHLNADRVIVTDDNPRSENPDAIRAAILAEAKGADDIGDRAQAIKAGISAPGESPDVFNVIPEYNSPRRFLLLADELAARGWPASRIEKLIGGNFARLFAEAWGG
jgi:hypothetical protein